jgi:hypothetical protein
MICPCGGIVGNSDHLNKTMGITVYSRKCAACGREEKSADERVWLAPAAFWKTIEKRSPQLDL